MKTVSLFVLLQIMVATLVACGSGNSSLPKDSAISEFAKVDAAISVDSLRRHIARLSSNELEGRSPGSRGEELTLVYLTEQYSRYGLRPGNPDGTYVQRVPLVGSTVVNEPSFEIRHGKEATDSLELASRDDFMGWTLRRQESVSLEDAEMVFVGYGIVAPEYDWDDFKTFDVRGKLVVMLVGDPPLPDSTQFGGRAMTYYGRWTYKFEIAAEKGAAGAIIVHDTDAAGYPWSVVANSWSGEQFDVSRPNGGADRCVLEGWITETAAESVFQYAGLALDDAYEMALSREFEPVPLHSTASVDLETTFRDTRSYNVVAMIPGTDPALKDEFVVYMAHWDHLGVGDPVDGDSIYNGALDNASGVAATLEIARSLVAQRDRLRRSILIVNTTAEESGLLGSYYYVQHPLVQLTKTIATINIDGLNIWGPTRDMVVVGYGFSELDDYLRWAIEDQGRYLKPDPESEKGYYYRSDHFPFAKKGVPSLYADSGADYVDRPEGWGLEVRQKYTRERYHKPQDEFKDTWNLDGAVQDIEALVRVGLMIAGGAGYPQWTEGNEFKQIRDAALEASR